MVFVEGMWLLLWSFGFWKILLSLLILIEIPSWLIPLRKGSVWGCFLVRLDFIARSTGVPAGGGAPVKRLVSVLSVLFHSICNFPKGYHWISLRFQCLPELFSEQLLVWVSKIRLTDLSHYLAQAVFLVYQLRDDQISSCLRYVIYGVAEKGQEALNRVNIVYQNQIFVGNLNTELPRTRYQLSS